MKIRLTTRRIMRLTALVGLTIATCFEVENRRLRNQAVASEVRHRAVAAFHDHQAAYCRGPVRATPYDESTRIEAITHGIGYSLKTVRTWAEEADLHIHWVRAKGYFADRDRDKIHRYQSRLLLPF